MSVQDIDRGWRLLARNMVRYAPGPNVTVGIQGTEAEEERTPDMDNAALATVHEFGSRDGHIPQRSFMRGTIDRNRQLVNKMLQTAARRSVLRGDIKRELGIVGAKVRTEMVRTINNSIGLKPNADATIERKGSTKPLVDTGILKNSITWKVHSV